MADATFQAIDAHSTIGEFKIVLHYDNVTLLITSAEVFNFTGDTQHVTVGTHVFDVVDGTNLVGVNALQLGSFNQLMVNTPRGVKPPVFIG